MTSALSLQRLLAWLSPAFPTGAFAWSGGLETAIVSRHVVDAASTRDWIEGSLAAGSIRADAIACAHAWRSADDSAALGDLADLALALIPSAERRAETTITGQAFLAAARAWPSPLLANLPDPCPYSIAVGVVAAANDVALGDTLVAYIAALVQSQVSVAVRLVPIGQTAGLAILAGLEATIALTAETAATAALAQIGGIAYAADIAQMQHEALQPRIFRS